MQKVQENSQAEEAPTVDLSLIHNSLTKPSIIQQIGEACRRHGFFHVINHGVPNSVIEAALDVNGRFFELPSEAKENLSSDDVFKEVRFGHMNVRGFSRDFLKLCSNPLDRCVTSWPRFPQDYREIMGIYATEVRKIAVELFGAIMESLNLGETYLRQNFEQGEQILGINRYNNNATCSGSNSKSGQPPHTDHSIITILLQSSPGFQVIDRDGDDPSSWKNGSGAAGSFQVLVGDHLEVLSNGLYKSVLHRAVSSSCNGSNRLSIANLHSLSKDEVVEPAKELVSEVNPIRYRGSSLSDFLMHLASGDTRAFIETVKINE